MHGYAAKKLQGMHSQRTKQYLLALEIMPEQEVPLLLGLDCAASRPWQCIGAKPLPAARIEPAHWTHAALHWKRWHPSSLLEEQLDSARLQ